jgi:hypothetical protein
VVTESVAVLGSAADSVDSADYAVESVAESAIESAADFAVESVVVSLAGSAAEPAVESVAESVIRFVFLIEFMEKVEIEFGAETVTETGVVIGYCIGVVIEIGIGVVTEVGIEIEVMRMSIQKAEKDLIMVVIENKFGLVEVIRMKGWVRKQQNFVVIEIIEDI